MYQVYVTTFSRFWSGDDGDVDTEAIEIVEDFQAMLSEHYGKAITWSEVADDDDIHITGLSKEDVAILQAVAGKLELAGNIDGLELKFAHPEECSVFEELLNTYEGEVEEQKYASIFRLGCSPDAMVIPSELSSPLTIDLGDEEDDEEPEEADEKEFIGDIDVISALDLRERINEIAKALKIDIKTTWEELDAIDIDSLYTDDEEQNSREAFIISLRCLALQLDSAIEKNSLLFISKFDEDDYDEDDDYEVEDED
ncbi:MAG: hypothetical protein WC966_07735 [Bradymonadales bacterium]|jgi:hypothetical protein